MMIRRGLLCGGDGGEVLYDGGFDKDGAISIHSDVLVDGERIEIKGEFISECGSDISPYTLLECYIGTGSSTKLGFYFNMWIGGFYVYLNDMRTKISSLTSIAAGSKLVFIIECIKSGTYANCRLSINVNGEKIYTYNNYSVKDNVALWTIHGDGIYINNVKVTRY